MDEQIGDIHGMIIGKVTSLKAYTAHTFFFFFCCCLMNRQANRTHSGYQRTNSSASPANLDHYPDFGGDGLVSLTFIHSDAF
jgi:hypothetical protein